MSIQIGATETKPGYYSKFNIFLIQHTGPEPKR